VSGVAQPGNPNVDPITLAAPNTALSSYRYARPRIDHLTSELPGPRSHAQSGYPAA